MSSSFIISSFILASFMVLISALGVSAPFAGLRPSGLSPLALSPVRERESEHKLKKHTRARGRKRQNGPGQHTDHTRGEVSGGRGAAAWRVGTRDAEGCRSQREHVQQGSWGSAKARGAKRSVPNQLVVFGDMS